MHRPWLPLRPRRDAPAAAAVQHDAHTLRTPKHRSCCCCSTQRAWSRGTEQYLYCTWYSTEQYRTWYSTEQYRTRTVQYRHRVCPGSTRCLFTGTGTAVPIQRHRGYRYSTVTVPVKRHRGTGGAGTHEGHTGAHRHMDHADEPHNHPNPPTHPHDLATTDQSAAGSTAAAPEPAPEEGSGGGLLSSWGGVLSGYVS